MTRAAFRLWLLDHAPDAIVGVGNEPFRCPLALWHGAHVSATHYERHPYGSWWPLPAWAARFALAIDARFPRLTVTAAEALAVLDGIPEETANEPRIPLDPRAACRERVAR